MTARPSKRRTDHELRGQYRVLRAQFLRRCAAEGAECYFGDGPIDYSLPHGDPGAATIEHTIPVAVLAQRGISELETSLWRPAHAVCNAVSMAAYDPEGAGVQVLDTGVPSERWD